MSYHAASSRDGSAAADEALDPPSRSSSLPPSAFPPDLDDVEIEITSPPRAMPSDDEEVTLELPPTAPAPAATTTLPAQPTDPVPVFLRSALESGLLGFALLIIQFGAAGLLTLFLKSTQTTQFVWVFATANTLETPSLLSETPIVLLTFAQIAITLLMCGWVVISATAWHVLLQGKATASFFPLPTRIMGTPILWTVQFMQLAILCHTTDVPVLAWITAAHALVHWVLLAHPAVWRTPCYTVLALCWATLLPYWVHDPVPRFVTLAVCLLVVQQMLHLAVQRMLFIAHFATRARYRAEWVLHIGLWVGSSLHTWMVLTALLWV